MQVSGRHSISGVSITLTMGRDMTILPEGLYIVDTPVSASAEGFIGRFGSMILMKGMKHKFWVLTSHSPSVNNIDQSTMTDLAVAHGIAATRFRAS
jgi:hypothetical protein